MISDSQFVELDAEIWDLIGLGQAAKSADAPSEPADAALPEGAALPDVEDERRIERISEKARFEAVMKDSVGFLFKTMGTGVTELSAGVIAATKGEARSEGATPSPENDDDNDEDPESAKS